MSSSSESGASSGGYHARRRKRADRSPTPLIPVDHAIAPLDGHLDESINQDDAHRHQPLPAGSLPQVSARLTRASSRSRSLSSPRSKRVKRDETIKFSISEERGRRFKKILCDGLGKDEAKELSGQYSPNFRSSFVSDRLIGPSLDDAMYQRLSVVKQSRAGKGSIDLHERALYKIHQKILDATKPLLFLENEKLVDDDHLAAIATALALVGDAFHGVTDARRHAVLRQTSPSFAFMLSTPSNFKKDEMEDFFGRSFIKEMVKSADIG